VKLSIITVNLNNASGLSQTIDSIIRQDYNNFELIIIDGGSTDGSLNVIQRNEKNIALFRSEKDYGIYNGMNKGIKEASGEYCLFLNSGDIFSSPTILSQIFSLYLKEDIVYCDSYRFSKAQNKAFRITEPDELSLYHFYKSSICHQATFIKRDLFNNLGFYNENNKIASDWEFNIKAIIFHDCSIRHIEIPVVYFDDSGISNSNVRLSEVERELILQNLVPKRILMDMNTMLEQENELRIIKRSLLFRINKKLFKILKIFS
jgi:glycosyltransferase involved in cell wall biosynthesis